MKRFNSREARRRSGRARSDSFLSNSNRRAAHKAAQLCRQAMQALSLALADSSDDRLRELSVVSVDPAPDASRLLVMVSAAASAEAPNAVEILSRLNAAAPWLRREVASFITRKRAPELAFAISGGEVRP
jgi:ribosome-binding factor A